MELLRKIDNPEYQVTSLTSCFNHSTHCAHHMYAHSRRLVLQYTLAMMGYGPEEKNAVLELTYNYGVTEYAKGNAYAQVCM